MSYIEARDMKKIGARRAFTLIEVLVVIGIIAVAALVAGDMRWTIPPLPIRPMKFRLVVEAQTSPSASTPLLMPRQAPHVGLVTQNPASMKISMSPSFNASR